jgi:hypothetical protein
VWCWKIIWRNTACWTLPIFSEGPRNVKTQGEKTSNWVNSKKNWIVDKNGQFSIKYLLPNGFKFCFLGKEFPLGGGKTTKNNNF